MEFKSYNRDELAHLIDSVFFNSLENIPISFHRAISQINNPYCSAEDVLLWCAYENEKLVGYVGALPDLLFNEEKIYWLSCFWISDRFRNKNVASQLFFLLIKQYKNKIYISNFLFSLERTYQSLGIFQATQYKYGTLYFINFSFAEYLQARLPKLRHLLFGFGFFEKVLNRLLKLRKLFLTKEKNEFIVSENKLIDTETVEFLQRYSQSNKTVVVRDSAYFQWILRYPWILEKSGNGQSERYYFSSFAKQFEYRFIKIYKNGLLHGIVLLKLRNNHLTLTHIYANEECYPSIISYLHRLNINENIKTFTTFEDKMQSKINIGNFGYIFKRKCRKPYIFPSNADVNSASFQEGDGDSVFT
ncbi:MAG: GNAT family N-acetyltransferase [Paludibacteraceae bacterium]